ncbi:hypothetical protein L6164_031248 [Bauhinia variegata]|uniref:Uncharacterized protein n=1 Tax=Bauhinia variegata TaxID=167791 RepID=A0ACB9LG49_BAUVA|nr:hypothetical protein L6164_031248 [Bauhinia variegata]
MARRPVGRERSETRVTNRKQKKPRITEKEDEEESSISPFLTNIEVLQCFICYELLTSPVFQCKNGHSACSSCCSKVNKKCPVCSSSIGDMRNRAIEDVLESLMVPCPNAKYGCKGMVNYNKKNEHRKSCMHAPCSCPYSECRFVSSSDELSLHFRRKHESSAMSFTYEEKFKFSLVVTEKRVVLQEKDGDLFVLNNSSVVNVGNLLSVSRIAPQSSKFACNYWLFCYSDRSKRSSLKFDSITDNCQGRHLIHRPSRGSLLVPSAFSRFQYIELRIRTGKKEPREKFA